MVAETEPVKGVVIAERPGGLKAGEQPAFVPGGVQGPWGLCPARKGVEVFREKLPTVTDHHRQWVKDYEEGLREAREQQQLEATQAASRKQTLADFSTKLRAAVLAGEDVGFWKATGGSKATRHTYDITQGGLASTQGEQSHVPDDGVKQAAAHSQDSEQGSTEAAGKECEQPQAQAAQAPSTSKAVSTPKQGGRPSSSRASRKPVWALSADEAQRVESVEEDQLLMFAEELDYDSFVATLDDPQLKEAMQGLQQAEEGQEGAKDDKAWRKEFVRAMNHVSQRHAPATSTSGRDQQDGDACSERSHDRSVAGSTWRGEGDTHKGHGASRAGDAVGGSHWDLSSVAGRDAARMAEVVEASARAEDFLRENPDMKAVYSTASVRAVLAKTSVC